MKKKKILFVSYFYPPVAGLALPGTNRSVKFVRNMNRLEKYVLTVEPDTYPDYFSLDYPKNTPIADEKVIRTGIIDFFQSLVKLKNFFSNKDKSLDNKHSETPPAANQDVEHTNQEKTTSFFQQIKDVISDLLTYPDDANTWMVPAIKRGRSIVREEKIDFIFATGKPWSALIIALLITTRNTKLIVDFRDPWVDNPFELDDSFLRKKLNRFFERKVVRSADLILLNTENLKNDFLTRYRKENPNKFFTVTNGYDSLDFPDVLSGGKGRFEQGEVENKLVISHAGLLYGLRDPAPFIRAMSKNNGLHEDSNSNSILFKQIGGVDLDYDLDALIEEMGLAANFENVGHLEYTECLKSLSESDILLIIQPETQTQIPSKLYEYIYLNKPIVTIAPSGGALGQLIIEESFGDVFHPDDTVGIANYLHDKAKKKKENGFLVCDYPNRNRFDIKHISKQVEDLLLDL